jgi:hypothetical protein
MEDKLAPSSLIIGNESYPGHGLVDDPHADRVHSSDRESGQEQPPEWIIAHRSNQ